MMNWSLQSVKRYSFPTLILGVLRVVAEANGLSGVRASRSPAPEQLEAVFDARNREGHAS